MHTQLVSVVIPTRNRLEGLSEAICSVLSQTYTELEIIVVDDGSDLEVLPMVRSQFGERIVCLRHDCCLGASVARNTGLAQAKGEFVAFLDDDDQWLPDKLSRQLEVFRDGPAELAMVGCGYCYEVDGVLTHPRIPAYPRNCHDRFLRGNWLGSTSLPLLRKSALDLTGGFDPALPSCQDWDLWLRISRDFPVAMVCAPLVIRRVHAGQMTGDLQRKIAGRMLLLEKNKPELMERRHIYAVHLRRLGVLLLLSAQFVEARRLFKNAMQANLLDFFSWAGWILSYGPASIVTPVVRMISVVRLGTHRLYH